MATESELLSTLEKLRKDKLNIDSRIFDCERDLKRIRQSDVLLPGTRVRLRQSWNTREKMNKMPCWIDYLHFMVPSNIATIIHANCYEEKVSYFLRFDDQRCYYKYHEGSFVETGLFLFKPNDIEIYKGDK